MLRTKVGLLNMLRPTRVKPTIPRRRVIQPRAFHTPVLNPFDQFIQWLEPQARSELAYLVPLRLFIGIGWLRALAEKMMDPHWYTGVALAKFLKTHLAAGDVVFPFFESLIRHVFLPNAMLLGWIVMLGQLLVGVSLLTGAFTRIGLLGGLFMNLNFIAAGAPSPSAFYVVMQMVLLVTNSGAVLGMDAHLGQRPDLLGRMVRARVSHLPRDVLVLLALASLGLGVASLLHIQDFSPKGSIEDPAAIFTVMSCIWATYLGIAWLRTNDGRKTEIEER